MTTVSRPRSAVPMPCKGLLGRGHRSRLRAVRRIRNETAGGSIRTCMRSIDKGLMKCIVTCCGTVCFARSPDNRPRRSAKCRAIGAFTGGLASDAPGHGSYAYTRWRRRVHPLPADEQKSFQRSRSSFKMSFTCSQFWPCIVSLGSSRSPVARQTGRSVHAV